VVAERIDGGYDNVFVGSEDRDEVGRRLLVPIGLAGVECGCRGRRVGYIEPLDAVDLGQRAA